VNDFEKLTRSLASLSSQFGALSSVPGRSTEGTSGSSATASRASSSQSGTSARSVCDVLKEGTTFESGVENKDKFFQYYQTLLDLKDPAITLILEVCALAVLSGKLDIRYVPQPYLDNWAFGGNKRSSGQTKDTSGVFCTTTITIAGGSNEAYASVETLMHELTHAAIFAVYRSDKPNCDLQKGSKTRTFMGLCAGLVKNLKALPENDRSVRLARKIYDHWDQYKSGSLQAEILPIYLGKKADSLEGHCLMAGCYEEMAAAIKRELQALNHYFSEFETFITDEFSEQLRNWRDKHKCKGSLDFAAGTSEPGPGLSSSGLVHRR